MILRLDCLVVPVFHEHCHLRHSVSFNFLSFGFFHVILTRQSEVFHSLKINLLTTLYTSVVLLFFDPIIPMAAFRFEPN